MMDASEEVEISAFQQLLRQKLAEYGSIEAMKAALQARLRHYLVDLTQRPDGQIVLKLGPAVCQDASVMEEWFLKSRLKAELGPEAEQAEYGFNVE